MAKHSMRELEQIQFDEYMKAGNFAKAKIYLQRRVADINKITGGESILSSVCAKGLTEMFTICLQLGANHNAINKDGTTPFMKACQSGNATIINTLIRFGVDIHAVDKNGMTALLYAIKHNYTDIALQLISSGADCLLHTKDKKDALIFAAMNNNLVLAKLLIEKGINVNAVGDDATESPALRMAIDQENENVDMVLLLLGNAAKIGSFMYNTFFALFEAGSIACAIKRGHAKILELLIHCRTEEDNFSLEEVLICILCEGGSKNADLVRVLVENKADVNAHNHQGWTPLMVASYNEYTDIMRVLLDSGADINAQTKDGWTALMLACQYIRCKVESVKVLLEYGADITIQLREGSNAVDLAKVAKNTEILALLSKANREKKDQKEFLDLTVGEHEIKTAIEHDTRILVEKRLKNEVRCEITEKYDQIIEKELEKFRQELRQKYEAYIKDEIRQEVEKRLEEEVQKELEKETNT